MVFPHPLIFKSFSTCINPLVSVPRAPITLGIIVTFMYLSFFQFSSKINVLIFLFTFFQFYSVVSRESKVHNSASPLFCWLSLGLVVRLRLNDPIQTENLRGVCASHSELYIYHLFVWSNFNFLHNFQWITFSTLLFLVLYSFCANLLCSLIMNILSRSPLNLHLLFCCVLSIFALTSLWRCFILLLEEIQFLSFLAMSKFSRVRCRLFVG